MKSPEEQDQARQLEAKKLEDQKLVDQGFCQDTFKILLEKELVKINCEYFNYGKMGPYKTFHKSGTQEFSVEGVLEILRRHGWKVDYVNSTNLKNGRLIKNGIFFVEVPEDEEVGVRPSGDGIWTPSEYLAMLKNKLNLSPGKVQCEISLLCDKELLSKKSFEIKLTQYWKVRQQILVSHVRQNKWDVIVHSDKIVIKDPKKPA